MADRKITDNIWEDVTIISTYVDRGRVVQREANVKKSEIERGMEEDGVSNATISNDDFQRYVFNAALAIFRTPVTADSEMSNEIRILSSSAVKEVTIRVNNIAGIIEA